MSGRVSGRVRRGSRVAAAAALLGLFVAPATASAAPASAAPDSFAAGALHLATELDHLLAVAALALLAAATRARIWSRAALGLACGLAIGALSGAVLPPVPSVETINQASIVILGAMLVAQPRLAPPVLVAIVLVFAWCHGYANALDRGGSAPPAAYVAGVTCAATAVFGAVRALHGVIGTRHERLAVRVVGSWICAIGLMVFAFHLTRG